MTLPRSSPSQVQEDVRSHPRTHSVQFSPPSPKSDPPKRQADDTSGGAAGESSADEITPIISHQRGSRRYDGSPPQGTTSSATSPGKSLSHNRKRQKNSDPHNPTSSSGAEEEDPAVSNTSKRLVEWLRDTAEKYGSVELENKGSVARDHLALERTFLAWLRTSLAFASIGIAVTQLFRLNTTIEQRKGNIPIDDSTKPRLRHVGKPLGATFLGIAIVVLMIGGRRYFESQYWIIRGKFPASRGSIFFITFIAGALIVTSLIVVCIIDPSVFERR